MPQEGAVGGVQGGQSVGVGVYLLAEHHRRTVGRGRARDRTGPHGLRGGPPGGVGCGGVPVGEHPGGAADGGRDRESAAGQEQPPPGEQGRAGGGRFRSRTLDPGRGQRGRGRGGRGDLQVHHRRRVPGQGGRDPGGQPLAGLGPGREPVAQSGGERPLGRVLVQAVFQDGAQGGRDVGEVGFLVDHLVELGGRAGGAVERAVSGRGEDQDGGEREDVAGRPGRAAGGLLGGHEAGRADHRAGPGHGVAVQGTGDAEVDHARTVGGEQDVGGLEVAVDHPGPVDRLKGLRQPSAERAHGRHRQRAELLHGLDQRGAENEGGGEPREFGVRIRVGHGCGVGAVHGPRGGDLAAESGTELAVLREFAPDRLDRHRAPAGRPGQVDLAHAARAEAGEQTVRPDGLRVGAVQRLHLIPRTKVPFGIAG